MSWKHIGFHCFAGIGLIAVPDPVFQLLYEVIGNMTSLFCEVKQVPPETSSDKGLEHIGPEVD